MSVRRVVILVACIASAGCSSSSSSQTPGDAGTSDDAMTTDAVGDAPSTPGDAASEADGGGGGDAAPLDGGAWGDPCTVGDDTTCATGLFCLQGPNGGTVGFCTKTCPSTSSAQCTGTPPGTAAFCVVTDVDLAGDKGCAFACKDGTGTWTCPGSLTCETADDPPGSGQRLCIP